MENQLPFRIERQETLAQLDALGGEWTELIKGIPGTPIFLTWEWIRTWWLHFGQGRELWLLTARDTEERLIGIAPLMVELKKIGWQKLRVLDFIGSGSITPIHLSILSLAPRQEEVSQAFFNYLHRQQHPWDVIYLASLAEDSPLSGLVTAAGGQVRIGSTIKAPYVPLPCDWETYRRTVSKKLRRNLKYFRSKLDDDFPGNVNFNCVKDSQQLHRVMTRLEELNRERWHARGLPTYFDDPAYVCFHRSIASLALEHGWLRLYTLTVRDRIISVFYCFRSNDRVYAYQMGFDLDWSCYSPGRLLIAYGLQQTIQEAASELDWGPGEDDYKFAWTCHARVENDLVLSSNWRGRLWILLMNFQGALKVKAKQVLPSSIKDQLKQFLSRPNLTSAKKVSETADSRTLIEDL